MQIGKVMAAAASTPTFGKPFQVNFFVTARCNARCKFCFYLDQIENANANLHKEMTLKEIQTVFTGMGRVPYISLSGGEPFLRKDLTEIMDHMARVNDPLMISVPTNGAYPDRIEAAFAKLTEAHPKVQFEVQLSVDAPEQEHDAVRKVPGLFQRMLETNRRVAALRKKRENLGVKIVVTYSAFNQAVVGDLVDFAEAEMYFDRLIIAKVHGNCDDAARDNLDMDRFRKLLERAKTINAARSGNRGLTGNLSVRVKNRKERLRDELDAEQSLGQYCNAGNKIIVIGETGDVYPCEVLDFKMGNLRDYDLNLGRLVEANFAHFTSAHPPKQCHCDWGCAQNIALVTNMRFWPGLVLSGN